MEKQKVIDISELKSLELLKTVFHFFKQSGFAAFKN